MSFLLKNLLHQFEGSPSFHILCFFRSEHPFGFSHAHPWGCTSLNWAMNVLKVASFIIFLRMDLKKFRAEAWSFFFISGGKLHQKMKMMLCVSLYIWILCLLLQIWPHSEFHIHSRTKATAENICNRTVHDNIWHIEWSCGCFIKHSHKLTHQVRHQQAN